MADKTVVFIDAENVSVDSYEETYKKKKRNLLKIMD